jgi:hypothetical protein
MKLNSRLLTGYVGGLPQSLHTSPGIPGRFVLLHMGGADGRERSVDASSEARA